MITRNARICPKCGSDDARVIDSRNFDEYIRRRRHCNSCGIRFTSYEILADDFDRFRSIWGKFIELKNDLDSLSEECCDRNMNIHD